MLPSALDRHRAELECNRRVWVSKALLRQVYADFYERLVMRIDPQIQGRAVELGCGVGGLKGHLTGALATDLFPNPWIDLACDAYDLPFADGTVSHLILVDVFHHLEAPGAFLRQARRVLVKGGRVVLLEPFISLASFPVYAWLHPEPVAWRRRINLAESITRPRLYYAAQGNATRLFFGRVAPGWPRGWKVVYREAFASFSYLCSGGFSRPAFYPGSLLPCLRRADRFLSGWPRLFGARCIVVLETGV